MPSVCDRDGCNGAVKMVDSCGTTDPTEDRFETYECEYGHSFGVLLEGRR